MFLNLLAEILASIYDFAVNIVMVINIAVNKTFCIRELLNRFFIFNQKNINVLIFIKSVRR